MASNYPGDFILVLEASAAWEAGMSYGKWKALGNKITPGDNIHLPEGWQTCEMCGKPFRTKKGVRQKYCGYECRCEANKKQAREYDRALRERKKAMAGK